MLAVGASPVVEVIERESCHGSSCWSFVILVDGVTQILNRVLEEFPLV